MITKVKTLVFCKNFMGTETFTQWHVYARKINLSGNLLIFIYLFIYSFIYLFIYFQLIISVCFFVHDCYSLILLTQI